MHVCMCANTTPPALAVEDRAISEAVLHPQSSVCMCVYDTWVVCLCVVQMRFTFYRKKTYSIAVAKRVTSLTQAGRSWQTL